MTRLAQVPCVMSRNDEHHVQQKLMFGGGSVPVQQQLVMPDTLCAVPSATLQEKGRVVEPTHHEAEQVEADMQ
jgi:hypothetical protein